MKQFYILYTSPRIGGDYESQIGQSLEDFIEHMAHHYYQSGFTQAPDVKKLTRYDMDTDHEFNCGGIVEGWFEDKVQARLEGLVREGIANLRHEYSLAAGGEKL